MNHQCSTWPEIREPTHLPRELQLPTLKKWLKIMKEDRGFEHQCSSSPSSLPHRIANQALFHMSRFWNISEIFCTTLKVGPVEQWVSILHFTEKCIKRPLTQSKITYFGASPYSSDLNPNDFRVFPKIQFTLKRKTFTSIQDHMP